MNETSFNNMQQPNIRDLGIIGDRRSCALIDNAGTIGWYCPWRFDQPSIFSLLIDNNGGYWLVEAEGKQFKRRQYNDNTATLLTEFTTNGGVFSVTDWMPMNDSFTGLCRMFSPANVPLTNKIFLHPGYARSAAKLSIDDTATIASCNNFEVYLKTSHPVSLKNGIIEFVVPAKEQGWAALVNDNHSLDHISLRSLQDSLHTSQHEWETICSNISYTGPYEAQVHQSFKAIQLLSHGQSGGILAAATTSLPEVIGGGRNYDYRYVWLRDTAMVVSALIRAESKGDEAEKFLDFLCLAKNSNKKYRFVPFYDLDAKTAPDERNIPGTGYKGSKPVRRGNDAFEQLQLDANGNVLLAAKQIYSKNPGKPHWETISYIAEYLVKNWRKKDHGIWEEHLQQHFTSSKVIVAKSLEFIAGYANTQEQAHRWKNAAGEIRQFVSEECLTSDGAYAVYAGSQDVDVTAALFPVWLYDKPDSKIMKQTIYRIERDYKDGELYHRHLELVDSKKEGVFLAACFWMAQYYIMLKELQKAKTIIDAALKFSNDLGFMAEEGDVKTKEMLGNFPQTFVHASFIGVAIDYKNALAEKE